MPGKIVFLVEPDDRDCHSIKETLESEGYKVVAMGDVESALAVFPYAEANLVLTAHPLRVQDTDRDFATTIKRLAPRTLVIGLVKRADHARHALIAGCDAFIAKPVDPASLRLHVRQMIGPAEDWPTAEH